MIRLMKNHAYAGATSFLHVGLSNMRAIALLSAWDSGPWGRLHYGRSHASITLPQEINSVRVQEPLQNENEAPLNDKVDPIEVDRQFFRSLIDADLVSLSRILTDDFLLIDAMQGLEISKPALLGAIGSGQVKFGSIDPAETRVRFYQTTAVVTGRTLMRGQAGGSPFTVRSRYTHVYVELRDQWLLASAQGTQIAGE
jgi:ketosteroid isomerase-like protein